MIFGDAVRTPASADAAAWLAGARRGAWGTVGSLVPNDFAAYVRIAGPDPEDDWWAAHRSLFEVVAGVGADHTATPDIAWFAIWEGYGWETSTSFYAVQGPRDDAEQTQVDAELARLREADRRRHASIRTGLAVVPRVELLHRTYYVVSGAVAAVADLREPGSPDRWQRPDLTWPDDRRWFVATDVDCWSLYAGGTAAFVDELVAAVPTPTERVTLDRPLVTED